MAVLKAILTTSVIASAMIACYSPNASDCTLACSTDSDCISDQTCTTDHMCAASTIATCGEHHLADAGTDADADAGSGSGARVDIRVHLDGQGSLQSSNSDVCDSLVPTTCTFAAPKGQPITMTAIPHIAKHFDQWAGQPCHDVANGTTCTTTPQVAIDVTPKFKN